ncbi:hypothetical protein CHUAL_014269 [Chamberlinius hualienensis]
MTIIKYPWLNTCKLYNLCSVGTLQTLCCWSKMKTAIRLEIRNCCKSPLFSITLLKKEKIQFIKLVEIKNSEKANLAVLENSYFDLNSNSTENATKFKIKLGRVFQWLS